MGDTNMQDATPTNVPEANADMQEAAHILVSMRNSTPTDIPDGNTALQNDAQTLLDTVGTVEEDTPAINADEADTPMQDAAQTLLDVVDSVEEDAPGSIGAGADSVEQNQAGDLTSNQSDTMKKILWGLSSANNPMFAKPARTLNPHFKDTGASPRSTPDAPSVSPDAPDKGEKYAEYQRLLPSDRKDAPSRVNNTNGLPDGILNHILSYILLHPGPTELKQKRPSRLLAEASNPQILTVGMERPIRESGDKTVPRRINTAAPTNLVLINRKLNWLGITMYYGENTFVFTTNSELRAWIKSMPFRRHFVKRIVLRSSAEVSHVPYDIGGTKLLTDGFTRTEALNELRSLTHLNVELEYNKQWERPSYAYNNPPGILAGSDIDKEGDRLAAEHLEREVEALRKRFPGKINRGSLRVVPVKESAVETYIATKPPLRGGVLEGRSR